jgi:hypothetical protein
MDSRLLSRRALLTSLVGTGAAAAAAQTAKPELVRPDGQGLAGEPPVLSGSDLGFRVRRVERDGGRAGTLVVRVDGRWVEARFDMGLRTMR